MSYYLMAWIFDPSQAIASSSEGTGSLPRADDDIALAPSGCHGWWHFQNECSKIFMAALLRCEVAIRPSMHADQTRRDVFLFFQEATGVAMRWHDQIRIAKTNKAYSIAPSIYTLYCIILTVFVCKLNGAWMKADGPGLAEGFAFIVLTDTGATSAQRDQLWERHCCLWSLACGWIFTKGFTNLQGCHLVQVSGEQRAPVCLVYKGDKTLPQFSKNNM